MSKNILLYIPPNKRTVALETLILETAKKYNIILLTLSPKGDLHNFLEENGIKTYSYISNTSNPISRIMDNTKYLINFCKEHNIDVVWSHLHPNNLYSVIAQYFTKTKFIIFRHHFHAQIKKTGFKGLNKNELRMEKVISKLAKKIVVPSSEVYNGMVEYEKMDKEKIQVIPYIYNFEYYNKPNEKVVNEILSQYNSKLIITIASRMMPLKRHFLVLPILKRLIKKGYDIQVLLLDEGELKNDIIQYIKENKLEDRMHILGYKKNIIDYISASDLILHPSSTEASSSLIKEAGLLEKPVIVCDGVGDFSDYIEHEENGFLVYEGKEEEEIQEYITNIYNNKYNLQYIGNKLKSTITNKFTPRKETLNLYFKLIED